MDYYNTKGCIWWHSHNDKTYRIIPGLNKNLPDDIIDEGLKPMNPIIKADETQKKETPIINIIEEEKIESLPSIKTEIEEKVINHYSLDELFQEPIIKKKKREKYK